MVVLLLLAPPAIGAALWLLQPLLGCEALALVGERPWLYAALALAVLAALLAAAYRRRDNVVLMSAWLFLFCGTLLVSLGQITDLYLPPGQAWASEILEAAAFVPLLIFALYVAAPLRLLMLPRRRRNVFGVLAVLLLAAVAVVVLVPWLAARKGPLLPGEARRALRVLQPLLDVLLLAPVGVFILALGSLRDREPYPLIGLGLLLAVPADVLESHHLAALGFLFALVSQLYFFGGALLCATCRRRGGKPVAP